ncbi:MAG: MATE family efflux transporter [Akkermansiaceae bacterium]
MGDQSVKNQPPLGELSGRLSGKSLPRQILALALWPFLQNLMSVAVGFADMMIAGRMELGDDAGAAIMDMMGASLYLLWLLMIIQGAMATGAVALVARFTGARDMKSANLALGQSVLLGIGTGFMSGVLIWVITPPMSQFFNLSAAADSLLISYMHIAALSAPFSAVLLVSSSCLRGYGDTLKPFMAMFLVNLINVLMSLLFVYVLDWGVPGLAAGTVLGWIAGAFYILWFIRPQNGAGEDQFALCLQNLRFNALMLLRIWKISWPSMIEILVMWSVQVVGIYFIGRLSEGALGAHAMVVRLESISFMPGFAIGMASSTLVGQYLGAGNKPMAIKAVRYCWLLALVTMGGSGLAISYFNTEFLALFGNVPPEQLRDAASVIRFVGCTQVLTATMMVMKMSLRGAGATKIVTIYAFSSQVIVRLLALWLAVKFLDMQLISVWQLLTVDVLIQAAMFSYLHFKGDWLETKV